MDIPTAVHLVVFFLRLPQTVISAAALLGVA